MEIPRPRAFRARTLAGAALAALAAPAALVALTTNAAAVSQEAIWVGTNSDFNLDTAFFGTSSITALSFSADTTIGGWTFNPGALDYTFNNSFMLEFSGAGIAINGGSASITNDGDLEFHNVSTAGSASITNNGVLEFHNVSTAGAANITNDGDLFFFNASTAGSASITNNCCMAFYDESTAGSANITNYGDLSFNQSSTAGGANITNNNFLEFSGGSTAGSASITNNGFLTFYDTSTAGSSTVANTGIVYFAGDSTAGNASITNNGFLNFDEASTAGRATITNNDGIIFFSGVSSGGTARLIANGLGVVDFSPLLSGGTTVGSLEGSGNFFLGSKTITVGGNNLSTEVSGVIHDGGTCCGTGGAIVKEGTGTLTLSGINTYTGPTTVDAGALVVKRLDRDVERSHGRCGRTGRRRWHSAFDDDQRRAVARQLDRHDHGERRAVARQLDRHDHGERQSRLRRGQLLSRRDLAHGRRPHERHRHGHA
jgi:fibronectin-binding autotransporter adhesin